MRKLCLILMAIFFLQTSFDAFCGNNIIVTENPFSSGPGKNASISYTSKGIYLNITPSFSAIVNKDIFDDENWEINNGFSVNFEVGYFTKISEIFGFGFGLGTSSFSTEIKSSAMMFNYEDTDIDGDNYSKMVGASAITEKTLINYLDIPLFLELGNTNINKVGFYSRLGVKISFPISNSVTPTGIASYEGYYPQYHVLLYGIPELGFDTGLPIYENTEMEINPVNLSAFLSAGITIPLSNYLILKFGANANFGLMEISKQKSDDYDKSKYDGNYNKLLENPNSKTYTRTYGFEVGLIYNLRLY